MMQAVVCTRFGPPEVLQLREVPVPRPRDGEVLVRVRAAGLNALDWRRFAGWMDAGRASFGTRLMERLPSGAAGRVLGADVAGVVETVGPGVERLRVGDEVFGVTSRLSGAFAEIARAPEDRLVVKPPGLSFEAAAAVPLAALTALQALRDRGRLRAGQSVLVHGASGGVGTFAVQLARELGARVTAVTSAGKVERVLALGAVRVLDYARQDFAREEARYDLVLAVNGDRALLDFRRILAPGGRCVVVGGSVGQVVRAAVLGPLLSLLGSRKIGFLGIARARQSDLAFLADLLGDGRVVPVIDRRFPLSAAADAMRYLAQGHAAGKVVLSLVGVGGPAVGSSLGIHGVRPDSTGSTWN